MQTKSDKLAGLAPRAARKVVVLDQPPLGHLQALILKTVAELGEDGTGYNVLETLSIKTGVWIEHAQVYGTIKKLDDLEFIKQTGTRKEERRGPPVRIYQISPQGRQALKATQEHYQAVADFIGGAEESAETLQKRRMKEICEAVSDPLGPEPTTYWKDVKDLDEAGLAPFRAALNLRLERLRDVLEMSAESRRREAKGPNLPSDGARRLAMRLLDKTQGPLTDLHEREIEEFMDKLDAVPRERQNVADGSSGQKPNTKQKPPAVARTRR